MKRLVLLTSALMSDGSGYGLAQDTVIVEGPPANPGTPTLS
jgi:hypothetical protein